MRKREVSRVECRGSRRGKEAAPPAGVPLADATHSPRIYPPHSLSHCPPRHSTLDPQKTFLRETDEQDYGNDYPER